MNDLPVMRDNIIRKGFLDRRGQTFEVSKEKCITKMCLRQKYFMSDVGQRITHFRPGFVRHGGD